MRQDVEFGQVEGQDLKIVKAVWSRIWVLIEDWKMSRSRVEGKMKKDRKNHNLYQENQYLCSKTDILQVHSPLEQKFRGKRVEFQRMLHPWICKFSVE